MPLNFGPKSPAQNAMAKPPLQAKAPAPVVPAQRSVFSGIENAKASFDSNYPKEGTYLALIRGVKFQENRQRRPMVIIEMTCVHVIAHTDAPHHHPGEEFSHILMADKDPFLGNMKSFVAGCTGSSPEEVTQQVCEEVTGESQPLAGRVVEVNARVIITKTTQKPFTVVSYRREVPATEVASLPDMDEALADRIFGKGVLQQAVEAEQAAQG